ncbi:MAG: DUF1232 domain-containing protein [Gammaproteobacteria bacterium]|nr:MAG: DUF1232 domain-containing protein [Gammaproteobacteria bacterium]
MISFYDLKERAKDLKEYTLVVYFAARDKRTPLHVRLIALLVAAYALSPIDLIPDFIPIIGYLDDLILIPIGMEFIIRLSPPDVIADAKAKAAQVSTKPVSYIAGAFIVGVWFVAFCYLTQQVIALF